MDLKGKRVAVLAENQYQEVELWYPIYRLREAGAEVRVVAPKAGETYSSKHGYPVKADLAAEQAGPESFDAVVIPGGFAPDFMRRSPAMVNFVKQMGSRDKVVAAICHAGWMLCSAGLLKGKRATCFFSIKDDVIHAGAQYVDAEVVQDGNLITSRQPDDLPAFTRTIIEALARQPAGVR
jgi:protease I